MLDQYIDISFISLVFFSYINVIYFRTDSGGVFSQTKFIKLIGYCGFSGAKTTRTIIKYAFLAGTEWAELIEYF